MLKYEIRNIEIRKKLKSLYDICKMFLKIKNCILSSKKRYFFHKKKKSFKKT